MHDADHPVHRPAGHVLVIVAVALVVGAILDAGPMLRRAEQKPFEDPLRDETITAWGALERGAAFLHLDRPRTAIDSVLGREVEADRDLDQLLAESDVAGAGTDGDSGDGSVASAGPATADGSLADPSGAVELRTPTAAEPMRTYAGGDSLAIFPSRELQRIGQSTGLLSVRPDAVPNSGLSRPDFFNWPQHLVDDVIPDDPELVVLMFGGNDSQALRLDDGTVCERFTPCWLDEYERRVGGTMDLLRDPEGDRLVVWLGVPITGPGGLLAPDHLNGLYAAAAATRPWVHYLDTWNLFTDDTGAYSARLPTAAGSPVVVRGGDNIHFTAAGGSRIAWSVWDLLGESTDLSAWLGTPPADERAPDVPVRDDPERPTGPP